ncbi:MAG: hypothetical protein ACRCSC_02710 [Lactococcus garvieae]
MAIPFALIPTILGGAQALGGAMSKLLNKRPDYQIPAAVQQGLAIQQAKANGDMPNYAQARADVGLGTANVVNASRDAGNPLLNVTNIQAQENKAMNNLNAQNAAYKEQQAQLLQRSLDNYGQYEDQQWQMNEFAPYKEVENFSEDLFGAGIKNIMGGVDTYLAGEMYDNSNRTSVNPDTPNPVAQLPVRSLTQPTKPAPFIPSVRNQGMVNMPYSTDQIGSIFNALKGFRF